MKADKNPWHKRYHSDALTGFRGLTLEQRGAYQTILDLLYDSDDDALPGSDRWIAGQLDVSVRKWRTLKDELAGLGKIMILDDGRITNGRYLKERGRAKALSEKRAEAGRKGGLAAHEQPEFDLGGNSSTPENELKTGGDSAFSTPENELSRKDNSRDGSEKHNDFNDRGRANALADPPIRARVLDTRSQKLDKNNTDDVDSRTRENAERSDLMGITNRIARAAGVSIVQPTKLARAMDLVKGWIADGIDVEETIIPAIEAKLPDIPANDHVSSLNYFDGPIRKAQALKSRKSKSRATPEPPPIDATDDPDDRLPRIREDLRKRCGARTYDAWLAPGKTALAINGVGLVVRARSRFTADKISDEFGLQLDASAKAVGLPAFKVEALK